MIDKKKAIVFPILCIPVIAAIVIGTGMFNKSESKPQKDILEKIVITSQSGESFEYGDKDVLELYSSLIENSTPVASPVIDDSSVATFNVNFSGTGSTNEYVFIMAANDHANCVYKNLNGEYYSIAKDDAYNLLLRNEFSSAYKVDSVSKLIFTYDDKAQQVPASSYTWNYKRVDGEYALDNGNDSVDTLVKIPKSASFKVAFDEEPDYVKVVANDGTKEILNGEFAALSTALASYTADTLVNMTVEAKWYAGDSKSSYGEAVYNFELLYDIPASFELVDKRLRKGEFTVIKVKNGNEGDVITASAPFMEGETTAFTTGGKQYIYIPISKNAEAKKQTISVKAPEGASSIIFEVKDAKFKTVNGTYSASVIDINTEANRASYAEFLKSVCNMASAETALWNGNFKVPVASAKVIVEYGDSIFITGQSEPISSEGLYYQATNGAQVKAANNGTVIFAGSNEYAGNAVVIDHGLKVYSYYFNLGSVSCSVGDKVDSASVIGTVGTSGVTPFTDTLFYANSVDGYFVNPETQIKHGISFG